MPQEILCDLGGSALVEGAWATVVRWSHPQDTPIYQSYLWRVERRKGKLVLVAQDTYKVLPLTQDTALEIGVVDPSKVVSITDYPSQWQAWRAAGWGIYLMDTFDDGIMICAKNRISYGCRISGEDFAECLRTPGGMEEFLMKSLSRANQPVQRKPIVKQDAEPMDDVM